MAMWASHFYSKFWNDIVYNHYPVTSVISSIEVAIPRDREEKRKLDLKLNQFTFKDASLSANSSRWRFINVMNWPLLFANLGKQICFGIIDGAERLFSDYNLQGKTRSTPVGQFLKFVISIPFFFVESAFLLVTKTVGAFFDFLIDKATGTSPKALLKKAEASHTAAMEKIRTARIGPRPKPSSSDTPHPVAHKQHPNALRKRSSTHELLAVALDEEKEQQSVPNPDTLLSARGAKAKPKPFRRASSHNLLRAHEEKALPPSQQPNSAASVDDKKHSATVSKSSTTQQPAVADKYAIPSASYEGAATHVKPDEKRLHRRAWR